MKTWVKLYTEINRDPDMGSLTWAQRGIWSALLALAGEIDARDEEDHETGELDTLAHVSWRIRCDVHELADAIDAFTERGMVEDRDGMLYLPNYGKRQRRAPTDGHQAVAERVARHRERKAATRNEDVTSLHCDVTSLQRGVTSTESESDTDKKREEIGASAPAATPPPAPQKRADIRGDPRSKHPAIQCVRGIMKNHYPPLELYDDAIHILGDKPNGPKLVECRKEWVMRGHNPAGWGWLDWYRDGIPARNGNGHSARGSPPQDNDAWGALTLEQIAEMNRIKGKDERDSQEHARS